MRLPVCAITILNGIRRISLSLGYVETREKPGSRSLIQLFLSIGNSVD